jgi:uncharacterized protein YjbJ (UPF0337 family)
LAQPSGLAVSSAVPIRRTPASSHWIAPDDASFFSQEQIGNSVVVTTSSTSFQRVTQMTDDRMTGTAKNVGGKVQEAYGSVAGDYVSQAKGKLKQAEGAAQDLYGQTKDAASDAADTAMRVANDAQDYIRQVIEERPYTVAIAALAFGFLLGRMGRSDYR